MRFFTRVSFQKSPQIASLSRCTCSAHWLHFKGFHPERVFKCVLKVCAPEDLKSHCGICEVFISVSFQMFHQIFSSQIFLTFSVFIFCSTKQIFCVPSKPDQIIGATFDSEPQNMFGCQILCVPSQAHLRGLASVPRHLEPFLPTVRESWSIGLHSDCRVMDTN